MKTAILYTRVDKGNMPNPNHTLVQQEAELREYCKSNEIEILKVIHEQASGNDFNRPEFTKLHLAIRKGEIKADWLLFTHINVFCEDLVAVLKMHHALQKYRVITKALEPIELVFTRIGDNEEPDGSN